VGCQYSDPTSVRCPRPPLLGYSLQDEVDWPLVVPGAVDVPAQVAVERWNVRAGQASGTSDRVFAEVGHVVHAAEHAAIRSLGDRKFLGSKIAEGANGKPLGEELPLDQPGDEVVCRAQVGRSTISGREPAGQSPNSTPEPPQSSPAGPAKSTVGARDGNHRTAVQSIRQSNWRRRLVTEVGEANRTPSSSMIRVGAQHLRDPAITVTLTGRSLEVGERWPPMSGTR